MPIAKKLCVGRGKDLRKESPFGRLKAISVAGRKNGNLLWNCLCECGNKLIVAGYSLTTGHTQSCGCLRTDAKVTHGLSNTPEYFAWYDLVKRCTDPSHESFKNYGGRGITVCKRWLNSFENFLVDMGRKPSNGKYTIERKENSKGYEPGNCIWATYKEQSRNRRNTRLITIGDKTLCLKDWAAKFGISYGTVQGRLKRGWSVQAALRTPIDTRCKH